MSNVPFHTTARPLVTSAAADGGADGPARPARRGAGPGDSVQSAAMRGGWPPQPASTPIVTGAERSSEPLIVSRPSAGVRSTGNATGTIAAALPSSPGSGLGGRVADRHESLERRPPRRRPSAPWAWSGRGHRRAVPRRPRARPGAETSGPRRGAATDRRLRAGSAPPRRGAFTAATAAGREEQRLMVVLEDGEGGEQGGDGVLLVVDLGDVVAEPGAVRGSSAAAVGLSVTSSPGHAGEALVDGVPVDGQSGSWSASRRIPPRPSPRCRTPAGSARARGSAGRSRGPRWDSSEPAGRRCRPGARRRRARRSSSPFRRPGRELGAGVGAPVVRHRREAALVRRPARWPGSARCAGPVVPALLGELGVEPGQGAEHLAGEERVSGSPRPPRPGRGPTSRPRHLRR